eukprot:c20714_g1_i1.p1 GENE.c20714_g1_i1~~c20714_g1_i1.p1  ORF type:complete len:955 (-),score=218.13 c20714_g1_i1:73-2688(-)
MCKVPKLVHALLDKDVIDISYGNKHALALTADGKVYSWGNGSDGQLGHGDTSMQPVPRLITSLSKEYVVKVVAAEVHSVCITKHGQVYTWGDSAAGQLGHGDSEICVRPKVVAELFGKTIVDIAAGDLHTLFVTDEGEVFACGSGLGGRLGTNDEDERLIPVLIEGLSNKGIRQVRAFGAMSVALTAPAAEQPIQDKVTNEKLTTDVQGLAKIRSLELQLAKARHEIEKITKEMNTHMAEKKKWEYEVTNLEKLRKAALTENLKLSFEKAELIDQLQTAIERQSMTRKELETFLNLPDHFEELQTKGVKQIASGREHVLALLDNGEVKCFGENAKGQLGLGIKKKPGDIRTIGKLRNKAIKMIACGDEHSVALTYAGDVYCWGSSAYGQCGNGKRGAVLEPTKVSFGTSEKLSIRVIGAGAKHTIALSGDGKCYYWGRLEVGGLKPGSNAERSTPTILTLLNRDPTEAKTKDEQLMLSLTSGNKNTNEIKELIHIHGLDAKKIVEMLPNLSDDKEAQILLTKELNKRLELDVVKLREQMEAQRQKFVEDEREFRNNQAKAMEKADEAALKQKKAEMEEKHRLLRSRQVLAEQLTKNMGQLERDVAEVTENIDRVEKEKKLVVSQARTDEKASLQKSLMDILHDLEVTRGAKEAQLSASRAEHFHVQKDIDAITGQLERLEIEMRQYERYGLKNQLKLTQEAVDYVMQFREKLANCAMENLNLADRNVLRTTRVQGLSSLLDLSNRKIDEILAEAEGKVETADFVDPNTRHALMRLLQDNANLRKQVNHYTWGLMQSTAQKDEALRSRVATQKTLTVSDFTGGRKSQTSDDQSSEGVLSSVTSFFFGKSDKAKEVVVDRDRLRRDKNVDLGD